jgi:hypothetical protein
MWIRTKTISPVFCREKNNNMYQTLNSQQKTQRDLNYASKKLFLETRKLKTKRNKIKTGDKQRFNLIYIIRLPQNRPQAYVWLSNWKVQWPISIKNLRRKYELRQAYDTHTQSFALLPRQFICQQKWWYTFRNVDINISNGDTPFGTLI